MAPRELSPAVETFFGYCDACNEEFFQSGAVELAEGLVGKYFYFHETQTVARITETEAFPQDHDIYRKRFAEGSFRAFHDIYRKRFAEGSFRALHDISERFRIKGGKVCTWGRTDDCVYITAGPEDSRDLVHIRSCEPIGEEELLHRRRPRINRYGIHDRRLWAGALKVVAAFDDQQWESNPYLYQAGGVQLFSKSDANLEEAEIMLRGPRVLTSTHYNGCRGLELEYRFAFDYELRRYRYKHEDRMQVYVADAVD